MRFIVLHQGFTELFQYPGVKLGKLYLRKIPIYRVRRKFRVLRYKLSFRSSIQCRRNNIVPV